MNTTNRDDPPNAPVGPPEPPLATQVVRGSIWVSLGAYWNLAFGFAINIILTRLLTAEVFGLFAYAQFFASLFSIQPKLGLGYAYAHSQDTSDQNLSTYCAMEFLATLGGFVLVLIATPFLPASVQLLAVVLSAIAIMQGLSSTFGVLMERDLRFKQTSLFGIAVNMISYIPAVLFAVHGAGVWSLVTQNAVLGGLGLVLNGWLVRKHLSRIWHAPVKFDKLLARTMLRFGIVAGLSLFAGGLLTQLDNYMVATFVSITALGFYDRGYRLAQWPALLFNGLTSRIGLYTYAKLQNDRQRLQKMTTFMLWTISAVALPLALVLCITAPDLLVFLYTDYWLPAAPFLRILALVSAVRPMWENAGTLLIAIGKPRLTTRFTVIQVIILGATGVPLTLAFGTIGTCIAVGLAVVVGIVLVYRYLSREITLQLWSIMGIPLVICALVLLGYVTMNQLTPINTLPVILRLICKALYTALVFYGLMYLFQPHTTRERVRYIWQMAMGRQS
jgi:PST family polysaccharide transporter